MKRTDIEKLLPSVFRRALRDGDALAGALLDAMEDLHGPADDVLRNIDRYFDPHRAPDAFVPFLGQWVDMDRFYERSFRDHALGGALRDPMASGVGRLREMIAHAAYLSTWRGTQRGLLAFLEMATGHPGFTITDAGLDASGRPRSFHFVVSAPDSLRDLDDMICKIIRSEKPAYATYEIRYVAQQEGPAP
jgi:phage tail-like protein